MAQLLQSGLKNSVWKTKVIITGNQSKGEYVKRRNKKQEDAIYEKPELSLWQAIRAKGNMWNQAIIIIKSKNMQTASSAGRRESPSRYWF